MYWGESVSVVLIGDNHCIPKVTRGRRVTWEAESGRIHVESVNIWKTIRLASYLEVASPKKLAYDTHAVRQGTNAIVKISLPGLSLLKVHASGATRRGRCRDSRFIRRAHRTAARLGQTMRRPAPATYASSNPQDAIDEGLGAMSASSVVALASTASVGSSPSTATAAVAEGTAPRRTRAAFGRRVEEDAPLAAQSSPALRAEVFRDALPDRALAGESGRETATPASLLRACCAAPGAGARPKVQGAETLQRGTVWSVGAMQRAQAESGRIIVSAHGVVYDVTSFVDDHPGGTFAILSHAGEESTADFDFHTRSAQKSWTGFAIGRMERTGLLRWLLGP